MGHVLTSHFAALAGGSVLIAGIALAACAALRGTSASLRHLILIGLFISLIVLPAASLMMPAWNLPVIPAARNSQAADQPAAAEHAAAGGRFQAAGGEDRLASPSGAAKALDDPSGPQAAVAAGRPSAASAVWHAAARHLPLASLLIWSIGAIGVLIVQLVRWSGAGFIAEMATTVEDRELLAIAERIRWEMGVKRRVGLLRSDMASVTMVWGIRRPFIIMPSSTLSWPAGKIEAVLRHELAHVKRWDNLLQFIAVTACGLYWFNPFVWIAMKRLHLEREVACDNAVLEAGSTASSYAKYLMEISMSLSGSRTRRIIPAVMVHSSDIKKRLVSVLSPAVSRRSAGAGAAALCVGLILLLSLPVSALRLAPRDEDGRYFRSGKIKMAGTFTSTGTKVLIGEAEISDRRSRIRVEAKNVELDPAVPLGCRLEDDGYLRIAFRKDRQNIEYEVARLLKDDGYVTEATCIVDGEKRDFGEAQRFEFREIASELYAILDIEEDKAERPSGVMFTIKNGRIEREEGIIEIDGTIKSDYRHDTGSSKWGLQRMIIVDGTLKNVDRGITIAGRNLALDPELESGWEFSEDEGYMKIASYRDGARIEYECSRKRKRSDLVTYCKEYFDGKEVEPGEKGEREIRNIMLKAYEWLTDDGFYSASPPATEAAPAPPAAAAIPAFDTAPVQEATPAPVELPARIRIEAEDRAARDPRRARADERAYRREARRYSEYEDRYFAQGIAGLLDRIGAEFDRVRESYHGSLDSRQAEEAIVSAYEARIDKINSIIERMTSRVREREEVSVAIEGCIDVLEQYEALSISALESCERSSSRMELHQALVDFYGDLGGVMADITRELEDRYRAKEDSDQFEAQLKLCRELQKALEETRKRIEGHSD